VRIALCTSTTALCQQESSKPIIVAILHWGIAINAASFRSANYIKHSLISEQANPILTANICRNAATVAFRLGGRITTGTPFRPQNVYRNGVPVRSGTTTPVLITSSVLLCSDRTFRQANVTSSAGEFETETTRPFCFPRTRRPARHLRRRAARRPVDAPCAQRPKDSSRARGSDGQGGGEPS